MTLSISIVTTIYNDDNNFLKTAASIRNLVNIIVTHIVVDAGSSFALPSHPLCKSTSNYKILYLSFPGCSIYDGMNYGMLHVQTTYFQILNAGTVYAPGASSTLFEALQTATGCELVVFQPLILDRKTDSRKNIKTQFPWCNHESVLYPRMTNSRILHEPSKYSLASDLAMMANYYRRFSKRLLTINSQLIVYEKGGYSDGIHYREKILSNYSVLRLWLRLRILKPSFILLFRILKDLLLYIKDTLRI